MRSDKLTRAERNYYRAIARGADVALAAGIAGREIAGAHKRTFNAPGRPIIGIASTSSSASSPVAYDAESGGECDDCGLASHETAHELEAYAIHPSGIVRTERERFIASEQDRWLTEELGGPDVVLGEEEERELESLEELQSEYLRGYRNGVRAARGEELEPEHASSDTINLAILAGEDSRDEISDAEIASHDADFAGELRDEIIASTRDLRETDNAALAARRELEDRDVALADPVTIHCTTRTGRKVHLANPHGSSTYCGVWLRVNASQREVTPRAARLLERCRSCFGEEVPSDL